MTSDFLRRNVGHQWVQLQISVKPEGAEGFLSFSFFVFQTFEYHVNELV